MTDFSTLSLSAPVLRAIEEQGFTTTTEIQAATIPALLNGKDVIGVAQTGGGKTAAFVLPMIEKLMGAHEKPKPGMPRALILAPTRELALQISEAVKDLAKHTPLTSCTIFGGAPYRTQIHILRRGVDILVATPGRLMDHMKQGNIYLDETSYFVLDEADRMLDMGFVDDVRMIAAKLMHAHQTVLFSATLSPAIRQLADKLLNEPEHIQASRQDMVAQNLTHKVMFVPYDKKRDLLLHMIEKHDVTKSLIFVRTKRDADDLAEFMEDTGFKARAIHGDKQQRERERIIRGFRGDMTDFLVATDVAARGIDVKDIGHVFNMDVPVEAESYVHRIGRTARGGASGEAFTFCSRNEVGLLRTIERLIKQDITVENDNPFPMAIGQKREKSSMPWRKEGRGDVGPRQGRGGRPAGNRPEGFRAEGRRPEGKRFEGRPEGRPEGRRTEGFRPEGRRFEERPAGKRFEGDRPEGKRFEARPEGKRFEDRSEGFRSEGKRTEGRTEGKRFEGRPEVRRSEGFRPEGKRFDERSEGKRFEGRSEGFRSEGKRTEGRPEGKRFEGRPEGKRFEERSEGKRFEGRPEGKRFEGRSEGFRPEGKRAEGRPEGKRFEGRPEGRRTEGDKPFGEKRFDKPFGDKPAGAKKFGAKKPGMKKIGGKLVAKAAKTGGLQTLKRRSA